MILSRIVKKINQDIVVLIPQELLGQEVFVITKDDYEKTGQFIDRMLIKQKILDEELTKLKKDFELYRSTSNSRVTYLEKIVSFTTSTSTIKGESVKSIDGVEKPVL